MQVRHRCCVRLPRWSGSLHGPGCAAAAVVLLLAVWMTGRAAPAVHPLDRPLALIAEARQAFAKVEDYSCLLVKRETMRGQMQPEQVIEMKVRNQPFSVHLRWQKPKAHEGQEVCYVAGRHNGLMRVKGPGLLGKLGFVNLDPRDPKAMQTSKHSITEAGIGNLLERYAARWSQETQSNRIRARVNDFEFEGRKCLRIETMHPGSKPGDHYAYRNVLFIDKEHHLPIRSEIYDWPQPNGKPEGELMECFSFVDLKLNVKLPADAFNH
ncbi:MAG: DUF1571 domain-containing protein [Planctomycetia bacterium]|nr:DUF1571 domain-containing protein [Planctomycetia bacterium]